MLLRRKQPESVSVQQPWNEDSSETEPLQIFDWCCLPEDDLMSAEGRAYLDKAIENLPYSLRVVFLLRDIEGLSTRETADVLDLSETAIKVRLSRARLRLREDLSTYFGSRLKENRYARQ